MTESEQTPALSWRASVVQDFASSELFDRTFDEGMALVEETASYLDGAGRQDSKRLSRDGALAYASESMRLTTRLMQVASWLLVQRAIKQGDMTALAACEDRYRVRPAPEDGDQGGVPELPPMMHDLIERSLKLYERVRHLDYRMYVDQSAESAAHPVRDQHQRLMAAFGG